MIDCLLVSLSDPTNMGLILRTHHGLFSSNNKTHIFDPYGKLSDRQFSEGFDHRRKGVDYNLVADIGEFLSQYHGRVIISDLSSEAESLFNFEFKENDLILIGHEVRGYRNREMNPWFDQTQFQRVKIPSLGEPLVSVMSKWSDVLDTGELTQFNYNAAIAHAIIGTEAHRQLCYNTSKPE